MFFDSQPQNWNHGDELEYRIFGPMMKLLKRLLNSKSEIVIDLRKAKF